MEPPGSATASIQSATRFCHLVGSFTNFQCCCLLTLPLFIKFYCSQRYEETAGFSSNLLVVAGMEMKLGMDAYHIMELHTL